jgi:hypothetical protein
MCPCKSWGCDTSYWMQCIVYRMHCHGWGCKLVFHSLFGEFRVARNRKCVVASHGVAIHHIGRNALQPGCIAMFEAVSLVFTVVFVNLGLR